MTASPALAKDLKLGKFEAPKAKAEKLPQVGDMRVWVAPPLVKVDPISGDAMFADAGDKGDYRLANAVWDGKTIRLAGARGEYVSYQLVIENTGEKPLKSAVLVTAEATRRGRRARRSATRTSSCTRTGTRRTRTRSGSPPTACR